MNRWTEETEALVAEAVRHLRQYVPAEYEKTWARTILTALAEVELLVPASPTPRVWAMPTIPDDVKVVRDRDGFMWRRAGTAASPDVWCRSTGAWSVGGPKWIARIGPLTEVNE